MGLEPTTFCLGSRHSTAELHPHADEIIVARSGVMHRAIESPIALTKSTYVAVRTSRNLIPAGIRLNLASTFILTCSTVGHVILNPETQS